MAWEYVKVYTSILDSSIAGKVRVRHVFEDLLKLAGPDGVIDMTLDAIARRTGEDIEILRYAIAELCAPDPHSRTPDFEGRRLLPLAGKGFGWWIVNHRQYVERGGSAERVRRFRERLAEDADRKSAESGETPLRAPRPSGQKEMIARFKRLWMERYPMRDAAGNEMEPTIRTGDVVTAWRVLAKCTREERDKLISAFIADTDPLVVKSCHRLGLLAVRIDALRAGMNGLGPAKKALSAADLERIAIKEKASRITKKTPAREEGAH